MRRTFLVPETLELVIKRQLLPATRGRSVALACVAAY